jgi:flagellum-specific peptidoglycan hydrolase FlgJ
VQSARKARWQQATALVSLSTCGAITGLSFAHGSAADLTSPTSLPAKLLAMSTPTRPAAASDSTLRSAIVSAAQYYLRLAQSRSPSDMEALIWQNDSVDGADHGESCAAFASLTLEAGARATGQQSWVTGGTTYPWPVHAWVDSRVDPNPGSPGVISVLQDAQAHHRWHPLGDGYTPQPGDWVMFDGHVEVVTKYAGGVLYTIGGDSMPNLSVNAHQYAGPLANQGVTGFVDNGTLLSAVSSSSGRTQSQPVPADEPAQGEPFAAGESDQGQADIPGLVMPAVGLGSTVQAGGQAQQSQPARSSARGAEVAETAAIPGVLPITGEVTSYGPVASGPRYSRTQVAESTASVAGSAAQQAFINQVAPGALAAQRQYGIPASVTIAQAIDESGWGQSQLATQDNNLFGIKGTGPGGSVLRPTQEYQNGQLVTVNAPFRVYSNIAQSITDHSLLLATGSTYKQAMADRRSPDAFANDLTGVYATDPNYGASLITIMRQYNLYRFDAATAGAHGTGAAAGSGQRGSVPGGSAPRSSEPGGSEPGGSEPGGSERDAAGRQASGRRGSGLGSLGHGTAQDRAQPGAPGPSALIPGAMPVNAAALGMAAQPASGPSATGLAPARAAGVAQGRTPRGGPARRSPARGAATDGTERGGANIPGLDAYAGTAASTSPTAGADGAHLQPTGAQALRAGPRNARISTRRYVAQMPRIVLTDFVTTAKIPLLRAKPVYQDVAARSGIGWELIAACDWMQCQAHPGASPVYGEILGTKNPDGTRYQTKADALEQCAADLFELAAAVYGINLRQRLLLSVRDLANVFAAFRWGGLLKAHRISAMDFPYSVEGLTAQHMKMRWPDIGEEAPDKPGTRFRMPFGAVPVVLRLNYPAVA